MDGRLARGDRPGACSGAPRIGPVPARSRGQATATIGMLTAVAAANATRVALEVEENNGGAGARQGADLENESISSVCQKGVVCQCSVKKTRRGVLSVARR